MLYWLMSTFYMSTIKQSILMKDTLEKSNRLTQSESISNTKNLISRPVKIWLFIGVLMVFVQVVIGGITRLTDSGLSITEWAVIQGTIPPLNEVEWIEAFDKYKVAAKKQYETLHADMTLPEFKIIFFWEYIHRLWARSIGFVFIFPFFYFLFTKQLPEWLLRRLGIAVGLGALAAAFGWIMVASGLNDNTRTWVSAYKLSVHLIIATVLFAHLFWTWLLARQPVSNDQQLGRYRKLGWLITGVLLVQIVFGGLMAGMRAGLIHPYFPMFVKGSQLWAALSATEVINNAVDYEPAQSVKAFVQLLHRGTAYLLSILIVMFSIRLLKEQISNRLRKANYYLLGMLAIQFLLGVLTIINCFGKVHIAYGSMHQAGALLLLACLLFTTYQLKANN